jgi:hypothetical protein
MMRSRELARFETDRSGRQCSTRQLLKERLTNHQILSLLSRQFSLQRHTGQSDDSEVEVSSMKVVSESSKFVNHSPVHRCTDLVTHVGQELGPGGWSSSVREER